MHQLCSRIAIRMPKHCASRSYGRSFSNFSFEWSFLFEWSNNQSDRIYNWGKLTKTQSRHKLRFANYQIISNLSRAVFFLIERTKSGFVSAEPGAKGALIRNVSYSSDPMVQVFA